MESIVGTMVILMLTLQLAIAWSTRDFITPLCTK